MKIRRAIGGWSIVAGLYFVALLWADSKTGVLRRLPELAPMLPVLVTATLASIALRFARWQWLLHRAGYRVPAGHSLLAYVAGFAFTATPGKVGELLRVRYLVTAGVPASRVVSAFVYERLFDLAAVLLIALPAAAEFHVFGVAATFVGLVFGAVGLMAANPRLGQRVVVAFRRAGMLRIARVVRAVVAGLANIRLWATPPDMLLSLIAGMGAWLVTSWSFVYLLGALGIQLEGFKALALFPVAMLAGAASMLPGGLGSTEATLVALLTLGGAALVPATLAAVGIRLATLWLATVMGMAAFGWLETRRSGG
ncbi:MAG: flippase-like domain-containing protein [Zoogloea sp.]|nr:flippase-like domain-containing protein [Zoogloea sp.]